MELRRAADALLRSNVSPLATLLAPSSNSLWTSQRQLTSTRTSTSCSRRYFVTSNRNSAVRPSPTTSAPRPAEDASNDSRSKNEDVVEALSSSLWNKPSRASPFNRQSPRAATFGWNAHPTSADMLSQLSSKYQTPRPGLSRDHGRVDTDKMLLPASREENSNLSHDILTSIDTSVTPSAAVHKIPLRLNPSMGRHVSVTATVDVARAFRNVDMNCARNKVRSDASKQRYHERPGLKRKRLVRERWRKRFSEGFKATVTRVKQLKHQGW